MSPTGSGTGEHIEVDPEALIGVGKQIGSLGKQLAMLSDALGALVSTGIASGVDPAGLNFGLTYGDRAQEFADGVADGAYAFNVVGYKLEATGYNYKNADAASTVGGPGPTGGPGSEPSKSVAADAAAGPMARAVPPPAKWVLISALLTGNLLGGAEAWPSGDASMMRLTAAQWRNLAKGFAVFEGQMAAAEAVVSGQQIPEGPRIAQALKDLGDGMTALGDKAKTTAELIEAFADGVQKTQEAIRRLLDRLSFDGLVDTVKGFFTGKGEQILRDVARDVGTVLESFQREVKGTVGLLGQLSEAIGDAATKFQKWIGPALVATFGDEVGGRLAAAVTLYTDIQVGVVSGLIGTVSGAVAMADPDTWIGMYQVAKSVIDDPSTADDVLLTMGKEFIAYDDLTGDHPGRGVGEAGFNILSSFAPGGPLSKTGLAAKSFKAAQRLAEEGKLSKLGDLAKLGSHEGKRDGLDKPGEHNAPDVPEFSPAPGIPESVIGPKAPNDFGASPSHPGLDGPARTPEPPSAGGHHGGGGDDPPDPPGRASGPPEYGSGHSTHSPASAGPGHPADSPHSPGPSTPTHPPASGDAAMTGAPHASESSSPAHTPDPGQSRDGNGHTPANHEPSTPETRQSADSARHSDQGAAPQMHDRSVENHAPTENHSTGPGEHNGPSDQRAHTPTEHQPAHEPQTPHDGRERVTPEGDLRAEQSRPAHDATADHHEPATATPVGMPVGVMPMAPHAPGPTHTPGGGPAATSKTPTESGSHRADSKVQRGSSSDGGHEQSATATGATRGHTPAPVKPPAVSPEVSMAGDAVRPGREPQLVSHERGGENAGHVENQSDLTPGPPRPARSAEALRSWPPEEWSHSAYPPHETGGESHGTHLPEDDPNAFRPEAVGPDGRYKFSGHGNYYPPNGSTIVPEGTSFTVYAEHGSPITGSLGNIIETGGDVSRVYSKTFYPGEELPNYTLEPPEDLKIKGTPHTVDRPTVISDLLRPNMGNVDFAACLGDWTNTVYDVEVIYDATTYAHIHEYEKPSIHQRDDDDDDW